MNDLTRAIEIRELVMTGTDVMSADVLEAITQGVERDADLLTTVQPIQLND